MEAVITLMELNRRTCFTAFAAALVANSTMLAKETNTMRELLENCKNEKKSVTLYVKGQNIGGLVLKLDGEMVELRNREFSRIVVRIDSIDVAAMN